jgi:hypothetical protein
MWAHFRHLCSKKFSMIQGNLQSNWFWPLHSLSKNLWVHWDFNSQNGSSLGGVRVHSLTLSYTPENMRCDFRASLLAYTLASPCLGCKPKARVATKNVTTSVTSRNKNLNGQHCFLLSKATNIVAQFANKNQ